MMGLSPFEQLLGEGLGAHLWTSCTESNGYGGACPFCAQPMRTPGADIDAPAGLVMCHTCQEVWYPAAAESWVGAHGHAGSALPAAVAAMPAECVNCGAPYEPDENGRCPYCHVQVAAPQPIVVIGNQAYMP
jgi:hypothetical protein